MSIVNKKLQRRNRVKKGIRSIIFGSHERPRLSVYKSNQRIYASLINDMEGKVITSVSSVSVDPTARNFNLQLSLDTGKLIAKKAKDFGISKVVFDRSGYVYHGNVKAIAEGARGEGLVF